MLDLLATRELKSCALLEGCILSSPLCCLHVRVCLFLRILPKLFGSDMQMETEVASSMLQLKCVDTFPAD